MEAAVPRVGIVGGTGRAHRETRHGGPPPVVRQAAGDRVARAALGAVGEGVAEKPAGGIEQLGQAVRAGRGIWHNAGRSTTAGAGADRETGIAGRGQSLDRQCVDPGEWRRFCRKPRYEVGDAAAFDLDRHAVGTVAYEAGKTGFRGEPMHERAHANALDRSAQPQPHPPGGAGAGTGRTSHHVVSPRRQTAATRGAAGGLHGRRIRPPARALPRPGPRSRHRMRRGPRRSAPTPSGSAAAD